ncbi:hypothetical protein N7488_003466 [Penicillium malachiteum]|nr:hypothetical protein N7488_003466 [Penicillium malachiteum]
MTLVKPSILCLMSSLAVIINEHPDVSQKAGVHMMLLPAYKVYKDGKGPVKTAQGPNPVDLFEIINAANK